MTEHKFTDEEIVKALKCCNDYSSPNCSQCPYEDEGEAANYVACADVLMIDALDLINRQKAEIAYWMDAAANAKREAVKEFAERLKSEMLIAYNYPIQAVIDKVAKEMTEEQK